MTTLIVILPLRLNHIPPVIPAQAEMTNIIGFKYSCKSLAIYLKDFLFRMLDLIH